MFVRAFGVTVFFVQMPVFLRSAPLLWCVKTFSLRLKLVVQHAILYWASVFGGHTTLLLSSLMQARYVFHYFFPQDVRLLNIRSKHGSAVLRKSVLFEACTHATRQSADQCFVC